MARDLVRELAGRLVREGESSDPLVRERGTVEAPIEVVTPGGELHSWFVGVSVDGKLAGFLQLLPDLTVLRYSSFQRTPGTVEGCPEARDWIDPDRVREQVRGMLRPGEVTAEPYLTYDGSPTRLVWAVPVSDPERGGRELFVAGDVVYEPKGPGGGLV